MIMTTEDSLEGIKSDIEDIKKWSRIRGLIALREIVSAFDTEDKIIYNSADGETYRSDIAEAADVSTGTVSNRMDEWMRMGIIEKVGRQWKHLASLPEMGIDVPDLEEGNK